MTQTFTYQPPIIIAHRGASGYRPEHTLASYELAIDLGADYIEPDLVITKDGILIARHENEISETTDIANHPEFAHLKTTKIIDDQIKTGWFTEDLTITEIKTLRAKERIPQIRPQNTAYNGIFTIPTFQEIIDLAKHKSQTIGRHIGIYPETKHPSYFQSVGLPLEATLLLNLQEINLPIFIQSFEVSNLKELSQKTDLPLVQLINNIGKPYDFVIENDPLTYADLLTQKGLREIAEYAQAIGVHKNLLIPRDNYGKLLSPTSLIIDAHAANLQVHAWTFRNEDFFLPLDLQGNPQKEYEIFFSLGIDGVFSDYPDIALTVKLNE
ncbi:MULTISPECIES: glycerophosphodiester phosphodiesterase [unclassified Dolichospermum]|uniref:glycerophosphodiester phosphodiesterase n=1 Tax=unclassified Dolichospermum TaxID=2622029 RepID=UPI0014452B59|nr:MULTISPECIES: glycerophosphodiester phosphodiesterase [unclassified Dolichospermum]MTJ18566.1 glycerophosphodiester phosphodiesterase [Dolichospermum sp. UHCC 0299]MTJ41198.1 glycerophosphodiester phosphodiesterase [Dolichospermum sp. UHCC 0406]